MLDEELTVDIARKYIAQFRRYTMPGTQYIDFRYKRIYFDNMNDHEAIKAANGLMEIEAHTARGSIKQ